MRITDYEIQRSKVIGNFKWIIERYPNDTLMHDKLLYVIAGTIELIRLVMKYPHYLQQLKQEIMRGVKNYE